MPPLSAEDRKRFKRELDNMSTAERGTVGGAVAKVGEFMQEITPPSPVDVMKQVTDVVPTPLEMVEPGSFLGNLGRGTAQGMTFGASEEIPKRLVELAGMTPTPEPTGVAATAGEILGEVIVPYKAARIALKPVMAMGAAQRFMQAAPQTARALYGGLESGVVEGAKAIVRGENPLEAFAVGLTTGFAGEGLLRAGYKGGKGLAHKIVGPKPGEVDEKFLDALIKHDIVAIPSVLRPESDVVKYTQDRVTHSAMTRSIMQKKRAELVTGIENLRETVVMRLGNNAAVKTPLQVGNDILEGVKVAGEDLKRLADNFYDDFRATPAGKVIVDPYKVFERTLEDGTKHEVRMLSGFRNLLGEGLVERPKGSHNKIQKRLRKLYLELEKAYKPVQRKVLSEVSPPPSAATAGAALAPGVGPPSVVARTEVIRPEHDYNWWWEEVRAVGAMLDEPAVKYNPANKRLVGSLYHLLQDGMDAQAAAHSAEYNKLITEARASVGNYKAFNDNWLVKELRSGKVSEKNPEKAIDIIFGSTAAVGQAKHLFGPEAFNSMRQGWLRDLMWDAIERDVDTGMEFVTGKKLTNRLDKFTNGIDSEYIRTIFSDEGFVSAAGKPMVVNTDAAAKHQIFRELYTITSKLDQAQKALRGGQEQFGGQGVERGGFGPLALSFARGNARAKGFLLNLLLMRKGAEQYVRQPARGNIFLGAKLPEMRAGGFDASFSLGSLGEKVDLPLVPLKVPGERRTQATSAVLNRIFGGDDRE